MGATGPAAGGNRSSADAAESWLEAEAVLATDGACDGAAGVARDCEANCES
jgi:hypothetical protein